MNSRRGLPHFICFIHLFNYVDANHRDRDYRDRDWDSIQEKDLQILCILHGICGQTDFQDRRFEDDPPENACHYLLESYQRDNWDNESDDYRNRTSLCFEEWLQSTRLDVCGFPGSSKLESDIFTKLNSELSEFGIELESGFIQASNRAIDLIYGWRNVDTSDPVSGRGSYLGRAILTRDGGEFIISLLPFFIPLLLGAVMSVACLFCLCCLCCCGRNHGDKRFAKRSSKRLYGMVGFGSIGMVVFLALAFNYVVRVHDGMRGLACILYEFPGDLTRGQESAPAFAPTGDGYDFSGSSVMVTLPPYRPSSHVPFLGISQLSERIMTLTTNLKTDISAWRTTLTDHVEFSTSATSLSDALGLLKSNLDYQELNPVHSHQCLYCASASPVIDSFKSAVDTLKPTVESTLETAGAAAASAETFVDEAITQAQQAMNNLDEVKIDIIRLWYSSVRRIWDDGTDAVFTSTALTANSGGVLLLVLIVLGIVGLQCGCPKLTCCAWFWLYFFMIIIFVLTGLLLPFSVVMGETCAIMRDLKSPEGWDFWADNTDVFNLLPKARTAGKICLARGGSRDLLAGVEALNSLDISAKLNSALAEANSSISTPLPSLSVSDLDTLVSLTADHAGNFVLVASGLPATDTADLVSVGLPLSGTLLNDISFPSLAGDIKGLESYSGQLAVHGYHLNSVSGSAATIPIFGSTSELAAGTPGAVLVEYGILKQRIMESNSDFTCQTGSCSLAEWAAEKVDRTQSFSVMAQELQEILVNAASLTGLSESIVAAQTEASAIKDGLNCNFAFEHWLMLNSYICGDVVPNAMLLVLSWFMLALFMVPVILALFILYRRTGGNLPAVRKSINHAGQGPPIQLSTNQPPSQTVSSPTSPPPPPQQSSLMRKTTTVEEYREV